MKAGREEEEEEEEEEGGKRNRGNPTSNGESGVVFAGVGILTLPMHALHATFKGHAQLVAAYLHFMYY